MQRKFSVLMVIGAFVTTGFALPFENSDDLPFSINYPNPLKLISHENRTTYDYAEYASGEDIMQLKHYHNISKDKAKKIMGDRKFFILAMFQDQPSPYPGILSNSIGCPKELQPKAHEDTVRASLYIKLFATSNLIYGNCNTTDNNYYSVYCIFYCPVKQELFELKIFTPVKEPSFDYETFTPVTKCKE
jgi:hypothetical protein